MPTYFSLCWHGSGRYCKMDSEADVYNNSKFLQKYNILLMKCKGYLDFNIRLRELSVPCLLEED